MLLLQESKPPQVGMHKVSEMVISGYISYLYLFWD